MNLKELRALDTKKLHEQLAELRERQRSLRFAMANNQEKNVRLIRTAKRAVARTLSVLHEKKGARL